MSDKSSSEYEADALACLHDIEQCAGPSSREIVSLTYAVLSAKAALLEVAKGAAAQNESAGGAPLPTLPPVESLSPLRLPTG